jgi:hypothetical protein
MKRVLISDLKPGMRVIMKDRTVEIIDLARTHRAANGRTVYYWNSRHNPPRKGLDRFIGCGDLTVEVEDKHVDA